MLARGRIQNPLDEYDVRAGVPSHRWEARWNKWKGQVNLYKPNVPVIPLNQRVEMLEALQCVDIVRPYHTLEYV